MALHRIGIIGYGGFGQFLQHAWEKLDTIRILAVADSDPSRNPGGTLRFYRRWQDLIDDSDIDIVSVATPPHSHAEIACAAMEGGKNVLIEKPMAITIEDGERLISVRDRTGMKATVNYMLRFNPIIKSLEGMSREGLFGELGRVDVENYAQDSDLSPDHWFWNPDQSGGILIEHAVHFIDLVHGLTEQKYTGVTGLSRSLDDGRENQMLATVQYDGGLMASHYHSFSRPGFFEDTSIRLVYDLAQVELKGWIPLSGEISALVTQKSENRLGGVPGFRVKKSQPIDEVEDLSRPQGWGSDKSRPSSTGVNTIRSGGVEYPADRMISATFGIGRSKGRVYAECLRALLDDFIKGIENPAYSHNVTLEDGLTSLEIAVKATHHSRDVKKWPV